MIIGGCGIRVPVPDGSLTDITFKVKKEVSINQVNEAFDKASKGNLKGILPTLKIQLFLWMLLINRRPVFLTLK